MTDGYMIFRPTPKQRFWRALGFRSPCAPLLTDELVKEGWNEEVFAHTEITIGLMDRIRLLFTGRAKLITVVSAKVTVPEAITSVAFAVSRAGDQA